jgi:nucleoid-associated protein YgaU
MTTISFVREAGDVVFGGAIYSAISGLDVPSQGVPPAASDGAVRDQRQLEAAAADALRERLKGRGLEVPAVAFDLKTLTVTLDGEASDQAMVERIVLCCGNVQGVVAVDNQLRADQPAAPSEWHVVLPGETLAAISRKHYGSAGDYVQIFEANFPLLDHPDGIYPGQVLRIPA